MPSTSVEYSEEGEWDFVGANTKEFTHCFHTYPAMMIPQISRELISRMGVKGGLLLDPYCGTGTSLVEAKIAGMNSIGTDLNPLARLIAKSKTVDYSTTKLKSVIDSFLNDLESILRENLPFKEFDELESVSFSRLLDWFPAKSVGDIMATLAVIDKLPDDRYTDFLRVSLSQTLRQISFQRNGEFKLYRIKEEARESHYVPIFPLLNSILERNYSGTVEFMSEVESTVESQIFNFNTVDSNGAKLIGLTQPSIDLVVTSPPYGDSGTTVAYAQFSWLTNVILGLDDRPAGKIDRELMGGSRTPVLEFGCEILDASIDAIRHEDEKRAQEVMDFYHEYNLSIGNVSSLVKPGGYVAYVVGNRTVKGINLPTDQFTAWCFEQYGFKHIATHIRIIPNKRMPSKNSPTNITGKKSSTMCNEFIVVCQKL